jgi:hypothetical protein
MYVCGKVGNCADPLEPLPPELLLPPPVLLDVELPLLLAAGVLPPPPHEATEKTSATPSNAVAAPDPTFPMIAALAVAIVAGVFNSHHIGNCRRAPTRAGSNQALTSPSRTGP